MALVLPSLTRRPTHPLGNPQLFASQRRVSAWSPRSITATPLVFWYDPSCITSLFTDTAGTVPVTADGDLVACMKDRSGNGNHAIQATSAARPIYRSGGYLDFDGARYLATSGNIQLATLGGYSTAAAVYFNNTTGTQSVIDADNAAGTGRESQLLRLNGGNVETIPFNSGGTPFTDAGPSITATTNLVLTQITSSTAGEAFVGGTGNGSTAITGTLQTVATLLSIGAFNTSAGSVIQFFNGRFYGGAHYQGALNANDHAQLVSYFTAKFPAGASNEISGTSSLTLSPSATATGLGALGGSSTLTIADSGTLTGLGTLAGSSTLSIADSGTLTGLGTLAGSSTLVLTPSGTTTGLAALLGSSTLTFIPAATGTGLGGLTGSSTLALTPTGTATGQGSLAGSSPLSFAPAGTITGTGTLAGTSTLTLAGSGITTGIGTLTGSASVAITGSGTLVGLASLLASTSLSVGLSGAVTTAASNNIIGNTSLALTGSATLRGLGQLQGSVGISLILSGLLTARLWNEVPMASTAWNENDDASGSWFEATKPATAWTDTAPASSGWDQQSKTGTTWN